jgi:hypothetical protein
VWDSDPVQAFETFRDHVCEALRLVIEILRQGLTAAAGETLASVGREYHDSLVRAVVAAKAFWFDSPVARFLDRPDGPVHLDRQAARTLARVSGSCSHDLALGVAVGLLLWIEEARPATAYVRSMRFYTAAGDNVAQHLASLLSDVRCECQRGVARWREETRLDEARNPVRPEGAIVEAGQEAAAPETAKPSEEATPRRTKPRLEESEPLKFQVYTRIHQEHTAGIKAGQIAERLKADKNFMEQVNDARLNLNSKLVRAALACFAQRKRSPTRKNQETDPG